MIAYSMMYLYEGLINFNDDFVNLLQIYHLFKAMGILYLLFVHISSNLSIAAKSIIDLHHFYLVLFNCLCLFMIQWFIVLIILNFYYPFDMFAIDLV